MKHRQNQPLPLRAEGLSTEARRRRLWRRWTIKISRRRRKRGLRARRGQTRSCARLRPLSDRLYRLYIAFLSVLVGCQVQALLLQAQKTHHPIRQNPKQGHPGPKSRGSLKTTHRSNILFRLIIMIMILIKSTSGAFSGYRREGWRLSPPGTS